MYLPLGQNEKDQKFKFQQSCKIVIAIVYATVDIIPKEIRLLN